MTKCLVQHIRILFYYELFTLIVSTSSCTFTSGSIVLHLTHALRLGGVYTVVHELGDMVYNAFLNFAVDLNLWTVNSLSESDGLHKVLTHAVTTRLAI